MLSGSGQKPGEMFPSLSTASSATADIGLFSSATPSKSDDGFADFTAFTSAKETKLAENIASSSQPESGLSDFASFLKSSSASAVSAPPSLNSSLSTGVKLDWSKVSSKSAETADGSPQKSDADDFADLRGSEGKGSHNDDKYSAFKNIGGDSLMSVSVFEDPKGETNDWGDLKGDSSASQSEGSWADFKSSSVLEATSTTDQSDEWADFTSASGEDQSSISQAASSEDKYDIFRQVQPQASDSETSTKMDLTQDDDWAGFETAPPLPVDDVTSLKNKISDFKLEKPGGNLGARSAGLQSSPVDKYSVDRSLSQGLGSSSTSGNVNRGKRPESSDWDDFDLKPQPPPMDHIEMDNDDEFGDFMAGTVDDSPVTDPISFFESQKLTNPVAKSFGNFRASLEEIKKETQVKATDNDRFGAFTKSLSGSDSGGDLYNLSFQAKVAKETADTQSASSLEFNGWKGQSKSNKEDTQSVSSLEFGVTKKDSTPAGDSQSVSSLEFSEAGVKSGSPADGRSVSSLEFKSTTLDIATPDSGPDAEFGEFNSASGTGKGEVPKQNGDVTPQDNNGECH